MGGEITGIRDDLGVGNEWVKDRNISRARNDIGAKSKKNIRCVQDPHLTCAAKKYKGHLSLNQYKNSELNYTSNNGVYDNSGKRIGYEVTAPSGVTNVFDNNGNRIGYSPSKR